MGSQSFPNLGGSQPWATQGRYNTLRFLFQQVLLDTQTAIPVRVISCTNNGEVSSVGTVDVLILMNQLDGDGYAVPHGILHSLPYLRFQGGDSAFIMDPKPGDIGLACFCSRDITTILATRDQANPASLRHHNFSDGVFVAGMLGQAPTQYIRFIDDGIEIVSPSSVAITAPSINLTSGDGPGAALLLQPLLPWLKSVREALTTAGIVVPPLPDDSIALTSAVKAD